MAQGQPSRSHTNACAAISASKMAVDRRPRDIRSADGEFVAKPHARRPDHRSTPGPRPPPRPHVAIRWTGEPEGSAPEPADHADSRDRCKAQTAAVPTRYRQRPEERSMHGWLRPSERDLPANHHNWPPPGSAHRFPPLARKKRQSTGAWTWGAASRRVSQDQLKVSLSSNPVNDFLTDR